MTRQKLPWKFFSCFFLRKHNSFSMCHFEAFPPKIWHLGFEPNLWFSFFFSFFFYEILIFFSVSHGYFPSSYIPDLYPCEISTAALPCKSFSLLWRFRKTEQRSAPRGGIRAVQTTVCLCLYLQATLINILSAWSEDAAPSLGACEEGEDLSPREMFVGRAGRWISFLSSRRVAEQCRGTASPAWSLLCGRRKKNTWKLKPLLLSPLPATRPFPRCRVSLRVMTLWILL